MFAFHWSELFVVVVCGLVLLLGLALLMLRRRNEILQNFLTPEEPNLEEEFFRVNSPKSEKPPEDNPGESETSEAVEASDEGTTRWGTPADGQ